MITNRMQVGPDAVVLDDLVQVLVEVQEEVDEVCHEVHVFSGVVGSNPDPTKARRLRGTARPRGRVGRAPPPPAHTVPGRRVPRAGLPARAAAPRRYALPDRRPRRRGRPGEPQRHARARGHPRLHARDDDAVRGARERRRPSSAMAPGASLRATLVVSDSRYWLEELVVVGAPVPLPEASPAAALREPSRATPFPDVALVDQDGRALHLAEFRGRALALSFVFTRCPMPDFCPFLMAGFARAHQALVALPKLARETALLTVSFDVEHDRPAVLHATACRSRRRSRPSPTGASPRAGSTRSAASAPRLASTSARRTVPSPTTCAPP